MASGKKNIDMTQGPALSLLIQFTIPALASNLLNQVYTITDSLIVGRYLGATALAAVGVCMPVILLVSAMVIGLNIGIGILMSQCFGRRDYDQMRHTLANSIYLGAFLGIAVGLLGLPLAQPVLRLMGTPEGPMHDAIVYMRISFLSTVFPIYYFMFSNSFRGIGDGYTALYCLMVSVVSNVILDYVFVVNLNLGVAGSAYATALAQGLSVVFAVITLHVKYPEMRFQKKDFTPDKHLFASVTRLAVPMAVQSGFNSLGNVLVQSCINGFGEVVMASYTVGSRLGTLTLMPMETIGGSLSVYAGQNYGAECHDRIPEGEKASLKINLVVSVVLGAVLMIFGKPLTRAFLPEATAEILSVSYSYLLFAAVPGFFYGIMMIYQNVLRGVGDANASMVSSFIQLGVKVAVAMAGTYLLRNLNLVWFAWPASYVLGIIYPYVRYRKYLRSPKGK